MKPRRILVFALIAIVLASIFWWFSAGQVIQRRSAAVLDTLRMQEGTGRVQRAHQADTLQSLLASTISVRYPSLGENLISGFAIDTAISLPSERAKSALLYLTETAEWIRVENEQFQLISVTDKKAQVHVRFDLTAKIKGRKQQNATLQGQFTFKKNQQKWLLTSVTLEKQ